MATRERTDVYHYTLQFSFFSETDTFFGKIDTSRDIARSKYQDLDSFTPGKDSRMSWSSFSTAASSRLGGLIEFRCLKQYMSPNEIHHWQYSGVGNRLWKPQWEFAIVGRPHRVHRPSIFKIIVKIINSSFIGRSASRIQTKMSFQEIPKKPIHINVRDRERAFCAPLI